MTTQIYDNLDAVSRAAAELFALKAWQAVSARGRFAVALSGGHTPKRSFEILAGSEFRGVPWPQVHVFWGDERCVPPADERSNERMARQALLDRIPIAAGQIHPMYSPGTPRQMAEKYEAELRRFFADQPPRFDLVFLGLGTNGHTASLFPNTPVLDEKQRWASEVYVAEQDLWRVTLTAPVINQSAVIAFLVAGADKADVLPEVISGPREPKRLPAQLIQPVQGELRWLVDRAAAARLKSPRG